MVPPIMHPAHRSQKPVMLINLSWNAATPNFVIFSSYKNLKIPTPFFAFQLDSFGLAFLKENLDFPWSI
jgi:hypothetical protein